MSNTVINIDDLQAEVSKLLSQYGTEVQGTVDDVAHDVATKTAAKLKSGGPYKTHRPAKYTKAWGQTDVSHTGTSISVVVHNERSPQLTHLLEYGHLIANGKRAGDMTRKFPHIEPANEYAQVTFLQELKVKL